MNISRERLRIPARLAFCFFLAIAVFFLWEEHRAHFRGALPYVLLLLCPVSQDAEALLLQRVRNARPCILK